MKLQLVKKNIAILLLLVSTGVFFSCNKPQKENETNIDKASSKDLEPVKTSSKDSDTKQQNVVAANSLGKRLFILCASCHNVKKGEPHKVGPNLFGIFGQKAGQTEGFTFSEELINKDIVWNEETVRKWIENPAEYVPGTKMAFVGVKKTAQQDALIAYLKEVTKK